MLGRAAVHRAHILSAEVGLQAILKAYAFRSRTPTLAAVVVAVVDQVRRALNRLRGTCRLGGAGRYRPTHSAN